MGVKVFTLHLDDSHVTYRTAYHPPEHYQERSLSTEPEVNPEHLGMIPNQHQVTIQDEYFCL